MLLIEAVVMYMENKILNVILNTPSRYMQEDFRNVT